MTSWTYRKWLPRHLGRRHLRMIIRDGGSLWQSLRRVIRISVVTPQEMVDAAEGLPRFA